MAIDGRDLAGKPRDALSAAYDSRGLALVAQLIIWIPLALFAAFTYWTGTFFGGVMGGVLSVVSTTGTIAVIALLRRSRRNR